MFSWLVQRPLNLTLALTTARAEPSAISDGPAPLRALVDVA
ncbi:MAG: hypothetical protein RXN91_07955 [Caldivirga sp.]